MRCLFDMHNDRAQTYTPCIWSIESIRRSVGIGRIGSKYK